MVDACRNVIVTILLAGLLLSLSAAPGCCKRGMGTREKAVGTENTAGAGHVGVTVTKDVPHSKETISDIEERERTSPLPARGDTAIHSHKIPRAGSDNATSIHPGADNTVK